MSSTENKLRANGDNETADLINIDECDEWKRVRLYFSKNILNVKSVL